MIRKHSQYFPQAKVGALLLFQIFVCAICISLEVFPSEKAGNLVYSYPTVSQGFTLRAYTIYNHGFQIASKTWGIYISLRLSYPSYLDENIIGSFTENRNAFFDPFRVHEKLNLASETVGQDLLANIRRIYNSKIGLYFPNAKFHDSSLLIDSKSHATTFSYYSVVNPIPSPYPYSQIIYNWSFILIYLFSFVLIRKRFCITGFYQTLVLTVASSVILTLSAVTSLFLPGILLGSHNVFWEIIRISFSISNDSLFSLFLTPALFSIMYSLLHWPVISFLVIWPVGGFWKIIEISIVIALVLLFYCNFPMLGGRIWP